MPKFAPLARSPIEPAGPAIVSSGWEVSGRRSEAELRIVDCSPLTKVLVRADPGGDLARALGPRFGRAKRDAQGTLVIGSAPGEWLLLAPPGSPRAVAERILPAAGDEFASTIELTHGRALLRLTGAAAVGLLAKVCGIDFDDRTTPNGSALRTSIAKIGAELVRDDEDGVPSYLVHCDRSAGQYLFDVLCDAGAEFGIEIDGFRSTSP